MDNHGNQKEQEKTPANATQSQGLDRRRMLAATLTGTAGISLTGCLGAANVLDESTTEPVTIGVLAPNPDSNFTGQSIVRGAEVAASTLNNSGGILGRDVELVVANTNASPLEARRQYHRLLLEEGADITVGIATAEVLDALLDDIAEQQTIHLTTGSVTMKASRLVHEQYSRYKYHFRVGPNNAHDMGQMQIDFLSDMESKLEWDSIAVLGEDYAWIEEPWNVYQEQMSTTGFDVAMWEQYPPATGDFGEIYDDVEASGADAAIISAAHTGNDALTDWAEPQREFAFGGNHVPMQLPAYYELVTGKCQYGFSYTSATANSEITDETQPFVTQYQNTYDGASPVYSGYTTFDAIELFADAVERAQTLKTDELIGALEETSFTGTTGTLEFHGQNHEFAHDVIYGEEYVQPVFFQWQENDEGEGVQEVIWPESQSTADYVQPDWL